ncbi:MAG: hypothetical protein MRQ07_01635 [Candidatus Midichloria sp.]|nr:hypothetical protein [Candidatus Midichloria sp.]
MPKLIHLEWLRATLIWTAYLEYIAVASSTQGTVSVLLGNGGGTFKAAINYNVGQWCIYIDR